eukprot:1517662-Pyramimonas_sp.AAC.1
MPEDQHVPRQQPGEYHTARRAGARDRRGGRGGPPRGAEAAEHQQGQHLPSAPPPVGAMVQTGIPPAEVTEDELATWWAGL